MLNVHIVTLFPEFFSSPLACGLIARAQEKGLITFSLHNPRSYSTLRQVSAQDGSLKAANRSPNGAVFTIRFYPRYDQKS